jgi:hypothetical protein
MVVTIEPDELGKGLIQRGFFVAAPDETPNIEKPKKKKGK